MVEEGSSVVTYTDLVLVMVRLAVSEVLWLSLYIYVVAMNFYGVQVCALDWLFLSKILTVACSV